MPGKSLFASKTFWFNLLMTAIQILPQVAPMIPQPYGILVQGLGNVVLRVVTKQPITTFQVS